MITITQGMLKKAGLGEDAWIEIYPHLIAVRPKTGMTASEAWDKLTNNDTVKRGLSIAMSGGHKIGVLVHSDYDKELIETIYPLSVVVKPCFCGNFGSRFSSKPCKCSDSEIKQWRRKKPIRDFLACPIKVMVAEVKTITGWEFEDKVSLSYEDAVKNIGNYDYKVSKGAAELLQLAVERMGFSKGEAEQTKSVAVTIMKLDNKAILEGVHMSEAIQYQLLGRDW